MIRKRASSHVTRADGTKELLLLASVKIYYSLLQFCRLLIQINTYLTISYRFY
jgi:hypothetical protein